MKKTFIAQIPFSGFYETFHAQAFDDHIEMLTCEYEENDTNNELIQELYMIAFTPDGALGYAQNYVEAFIDEFDALKGAKFESMELPREYNFETDRIFIEMDGETFARVLRSTDQQVFERVCRERFTSRDGFHSYYSNDWRDWGKASKWDHNQIGALIQAYVETMNGKFSQFEEFSLMELALSNGLMDGLIFNDSLDAMDIIHKLEELNGELV